MATIKVESIIKGQPKTENLWKVTHCLSAEEIFEVIEFASREYCTIDTYPSTRALQTLSTFSPKADFACKNLDLTDDEFIQILTYGVKDGSLESFLRLQTAEILQKKLLTAGLAPSSQNKEDLIKELMKKPDALLTFLKETGTNLGVEFAKLSCVDLKFLRDNNRYIGFGRSQLFFGASKKKGFLSQDMTQFWRVFPASLRYEIPDELRKIDFFKTASSGIRENNLCILNLQESNAGEILARYVEQNQADVAQEFDLDSITLTIDDELVDNRSDTEKLFMAHWPNNQRDLTSKFGQGKKTKFETLQFGLSLLDRLEPTKKLISAFVGKKIYLSLERWELPRIGIPIEKNILEVLILHLKLEYLQGNTVICQVQEKTTDEVLNVIWEKTENNNFRKASFAATQLTD